MGQTKDKKVQFDSSVIIGVGNGKIPLTQLVDEISNYEGNEGTIYFTQGEEAKIVLNGADYTGYHKPVNGIPASDLAQAVQTSLGKADTAAQPEAVAASIATAVANKAEIYDLGYNTPQIGDELPDFAPKYLFTYYGMFCHSVDVNHLGTNYTVVCVHASSSRYFFSFSGKECTGYYDLNNAPSWITDQFLEFQIDTIQSAYQKPSAGIPKSDLTSDVQASVDSAATALQIGFASSYSALPTAADNKNKIYVVGDLQTINAPKDVYFVRKKEAAGGGSATYSWEKLDSKNLDAPVITDGVVAATPTAGDSSHKIADTAFVQQEIASKIAAADALIFKGVKTGGNTGQYGALTPAANMGDTYKISGAGKIDGIPVEIGDLLICVENAVAATVDNWSSIASKWTVIQNNIDGAVTGPSSAVNNRIAVFDGTTGKIIKDGGIAVSDITDRQVTAENYHYLPERDNNSDIIANGQSHPNGVFNVLYRDTKGHLVGGDVVDVKPLQSSVDSNNVTPDINPAGTDSTIEYMTRISQDTLGVITVKKHYLPVVTAPVTGVTSGTDGVMSKTQYADILNSLTWK